MKKSKVLRDDCRQFEEIFQYEAELSIHTKMSLLFLTVTMQVLIIPHLRNSARNLSVIDKRKI